MSDDLRDDEETRCELHQQVDDLRERLWNICDERKEQAEKERSGSFMITAHIRRMGKVMFSRATVCLGGGLPQSLVQGPFWVPKDRGISQDTGTPCKDRGPPRERLHRGRYPSCVFTQEDFLATEKLTHANTHELTQEPISAQLKIVLFWK